MVTRNQVSTEEFNPLGTPDEAVSPIGTAQKRRGKSIYIPLDADGKLDASRIKDPSRLEAARQALAANAPPPPPPTETPKFPRQMVPHIYDLLGSVIGLTVRLAKWPKVMSNEQRAFFAAQLKYSDEFKNEAAEPTAAILDKFVGKSKLAVWLIENSDVAILGKMLAEETQRMFVRAAMAFNAEQQRLAEEAAAKKAKANGGFTAGGSEYRGPENPPQPI
jgi:hypothetical protein